MKVDERYSTESDAVDDVYGQYPFMLYKHYFITQTNIIKFCKQMSKINQRLTLSVDERNTIEYLEILIQ